MSCFQTFKTDISGIDLPAKFTFPFYYEPHPLTLIASEELQRYLETQDEFHHNFGLDPSQEGTPVGKMFGVLVVQNQEKKLGYLAAFSGSLADKSLPNNFVPPVFDVHSKHSFYPEEEQELNAYNRQIEALEAEPEYLKLQQIVKIKIADTERVLQEGRDHLKATKKQRKERRTKAEASLSPEEFISFKEQLAKESIKGQNLFKVQARELKEELLAVQQQLEGYTNQITALKTERKNKSAKLQQKIFDNYQFLNQQQQIKKLTEIFPNFQEQRPPAGSGDCSAPKLLQYAFLNDLKPIAMGEFWWGISPKTEIRKHKLFYPACGGRCKPILGHMLDGMEVEENPFLKGPDSNKEIVVVYEDEALLVINKPSEFLSVPGKEISDSVYTRIKKRYPEATGPLIIHRLDMSTSGILVLAKTKKAHKEIQTQFISRTVKKRYIALLDGMLEEKEGYINLPLRVDLDDRPRQLVCNEHGKPAKTQWKVIEQKDGKTRIHFYPITGRTHQLRVHAAHPLGLNTPIIGDDLYGKKSNRLHLHAEYIEFMHPVTKEKINFTIAPDF